MIKIIKEYWNIIFYLFFLDSGSAIRIIVRLELATRGSLINNDQVFNSIITSHAFVIIFFTVIPFTIGRFGNFLVPQILGTPDIAYPRINNIRF